MTGDDVLFTLVLAVAARDITVAVLRYRGQQRQADRKSADVRLAGLRAAIAPKEPKP